MIPSVKQLLIVASYSAYKGGDDIAIWKANKNISQCQIVSFSIVIIEFSSYQCVLIFINNHRYTQPQV